MATGSAAVTEGSAGGNTAEERLARAAEGIKTAADFAKFMSSLMGALVRGDIDHKTANAITRSAQTMLKVVEMQIKVGRALPLTEYPQLPEKPAERKEVTKVTQVTSPQKSPAAQLPSGNQGKGPWCVDCYVSRKIHIKATEELDGDDLCLPCRNERNKEK
jgi:hypothetical protein